LFDQPIVMLDFETTGLSPVGGDRITEVAALRIVDGVVAERYVTLINCGVRIPSFVTALTGISQRMVDGAPAVRQVLPELLEFIGDDALAAHNAGFDARFLLAESQRLGLSPRHRGLICSLMLARRILPGQGSYKLGGLAQALNITYRGVAHRAEADAEVSTRLLLHIGESIQRRYQCESIAPSLLVAINRQSAAKVPSFLGRTFAGNQVASARSNLRAGG
jgi:DNA polymerase-3 subunit epsilon